MAIPPLAQIPKEKGKMEKNLTGRIRNLLEPIVVSLGYIVWDISFARNKKQSALTVEIDRDGGFITLDDCERVHRAVEAALDEADPIEGSYTLEVSSAGVERVLKHPWQTERMAGSKADVKLFAPVGGKRLFRGVLGEVRDGVLTLSAENGEDLRFRFSDISSIWERT